MSLKGKTVVITRPEAQARELVRIISRLGGKPYVAPTVEIRPPENRRQVKALIHKIIRGQVDYVIFMSVNGVVGLIEVSEKAGLKTKLLKELNRAKVMTVGPKTKTAIKNYGIRVGLTPLKFSSEGIIEKLRSVNLHGKTVAIPRTREVDPYLREKLEKMGAHVLETSVYESTPPSDESKMLKLLNDLFNGKIDIITFTSSATARNLFKTADKHGLVSRLQSCLRGKVVVTAIGPMTQRTLEDLGAKVDVVPNEYTVEDMVKAIVKFIRRNK